MEFFSKVLGLSIFSLQVFSVFAMTERNEEYQCAEGEQSVSYWGGGHSISHCEQTWSQAGKNIAMINNGNPCIRPCLNVSSGLILLSRCDNITLHVLCVAGSVAVNEEKIHYSGKSVSNNGDHGTNKDSIGPNNHTGVWIALIFFCCCYVT